jgi:hypothetical protein
MRKHEHLRSRSIARGWLSTRRLKVVYQATNGQLAYTTMPLRQAQLTVR